MNLWSLRKARKLLVGRLRGDNAGRVFVQIAQPHGKTAGIYRVKLHEAGPRLVEHDIIAEWPDAFENVLRVVDRSIVSALLDHRGAERPRPPPSVGIFNKRIGPDRLANRVLFEGGRPDRTDQAVSVSVGRQINQNAAGHQQGAVMGRLVIVAVEKNKIAIGDQSRQHDLVGRRGSVKNEIGSFRAEYRGGFFLRLKGRALMCEKIAELEN